MGTEIAAAEAQPHGIEAAILVVDDHPENILALRATLSNAAYRVVGAASGPEALCQVLKHHFAVILMDVFMPGMDGFETARLIRQREASRDIPIIFVTASGANVEFMDRGYAMGAVDYLVKPINPTMVRAKVAVFVDIFVRAERIRRHETRLRQLELQRAEAVVRDSHAQHGATFNEAPVGMAHLGADGTVLRVNPKLCAMLGYEADALLGKSSAIFSHPEDLAAQAAALWRMGHGSEQVERCERRFVRADGGIVWGRLALSVLTAKPLVLLYIVEDITEQRAWRAHQTLLSRAGEVLLEPLDVEAMQRRVAHLMVPDFGEWCVIDVAAGEDIPASQAIAHAHEPIAPDVLAMVRRRHATASTGDDPAVIRVLLQIRGHSLGVMTLGTHDVPYTDADVGIAQELGRRIAAALDNARLYQIAQRAIELRDTFLSIASHELRTPLTPLRLRLDHAVRYPDKMTKEKLERTIAAADRQVQRLIQLVDNLFDVSQLTSQGLRLMRQAVDLDAVVREVVDKLAAEHEAGSSTIDIDSQGTIVGEWDHGRLVQVVYNLLSNSIKYGRARGIKVTLRAQGAQATLEIADQGIGIKPHKLAAIFKIYERAVSERNYGGLGLGLFVVHEIVAAHGGTVSVDSEFGVGSCFRVELPLQP